MCKSQIQKTEKKILAYGKKISASKSKSAAFLMSIGVTNQQGEVTEHYKQLCTPHAQG